MSSFIEFPKLSRWFRPIIVTEKLDGTNAQVAWLPVEGEPSPLGLSVFHDFGDGFGPRQLFAGSRTQWIQPGRDNFGFAAWVAKQADELRGLGPGSHFGEWWGQGVQRGYGLTEKRFSLFNVSRWTDDARPACCGVVPILYEGPNSEAEIQAAAARLEQTGSIAAPGFMKPEGVVIFHVHSNTLFKYTPAHKQDGHKG
jgi:hypothetical protein